MAQSLSIEQARRVAVAAQRLSASMTGTAKELAARTIEHLGYIQIDTISVVARAHHHTLWARCPGYRSTHLDELVAKDRRVFEYWAHAVAYLPMADYRFYTPRMDRHRTGESAWLEQWRKEHGHILNDVLERIRAEGALTSKDFEPPPGTKRGTWWDWKPAKRALEILFWQGLLMISERRNFQKVYDLTERVLPPGVETTRPSVEEMGQFHVRRALGGLGVAREKEIRDAFHVADRKTLTQSLAVMVKDRSVVKVKIADLDDEYYVLPETLGLVDSAPDEAAHILSPFDNLTIQRDRLEKLFDFHYTLECYLPETKRVHGYFVLPILWRDRFIGRLDAKADRQGKTLVAKRLLFEPLFDDYDAGLPPLADALARFARFNRCGTVQMEQIVPTGHKRRLTSLVRKALAAG